MTLFMLLYCIPLILVAVAMIILANGQRTASRAQADAVRKFAGRIAALGRK